MLANRVKSEIPLDLIHVNGPRDHWVMATANYFFPNKVPLVRTRQNTKPVRNNFYNRFLNHELTDQIISPCQDLKEMYAESPVFHGCEITAIHHGVEIEHFSPRPPDEKVRKEIGVSEEDLVLGILGRLDWDKGHKYLLEAAAPLINGEMPNIKIIVVGFGEEHESLKRLCKQLNIERNVMFLGRRTDVKEVVSVFDIGVHPSIGVDTSSYAMKEMMAMEKPIVCSDYGGLKEIAVDGVTGYLVPPRDSELLRDRIAALGRSRELREQFGKAGRMRVEREFTAKVSVERTISVYERAIEGHKRKRDRA
jgi:glycosyltransferase involved in cell wall biosynthesis